jgi:hypothetical protein
MIFKKDSKRKATLQKCKITLHKFKKYDRQVVSNPRNSKYVQKIGNVKRVIYLRKTCSVVTFQI